MQRDSIMVRVDTFSYHTSVFSLLELGVQAWVVRDTGQKQSAHERGTGNQKWKA